MDKNKLIYQIREAKRAHVSWVMKADALIQGIPLEQDQVPVNGTECKFGHWYYGEGQNLSFLQSYKAIEQPHFNLHSTYAQIFKLLFDETRQGMLEKLFGKSKKAEEVKLLKARQMFPELRKHSEEVIAALEGLEAELAGINECVLLAKVQGS